MSSMLGRVGCRRRLTLGRWIWEMVPRRLVNESSECVNEAVQQPEGQKQGDGRRPTIGGGAPCWGVCCSRGRTTPGSRGGGPALSTARVRRGGPSAWPTGRETERGWTRRGAHVLRIRQIRIESYIFSTFLTVNLDDGSPTRSPSGKGGPNRWNRCLRSPKALGAPLPPFAAAPALSDVANAVETWLARPGHEVSGCKGRDGYPAANTGIFQNAESSLRALRKRALNNTTEFIGFGGTSLLQQVRSDHST
jgi:hypothetical protein